MELNNPPELRINLFYKKHRFELDFLYICDLVRKYILQNNMKIKTEKVKKNEVLDILNFLVERGSAIGYMLRDRIL